MRNRWSGLRGCLSLALSLALSLGGVPAALADEALAGTDAAIEADATSDAPDRDAAGPVEGEGVIAGTGDDGSVVTNGPVVGQEEPVGIEVLDGDATVEEDVPELEPVDVAEETAGQPGVAGISAQDDGSQPVERQDVASKQGSAGATKSMTKSAISTPTVQYQVHRQTYGWESGWKTSGAVSGTTGQSKRLEGICIRLSPGLKAAGGIRYRTHVQTYGWEKGWKYNGEMSGTTGQSKRLEAIQISLTSGLDYDFDVWYRVHAQTYGWMGWAKNGARAGTAGYSKRLEAIQIVIMPKGKKPGKTYKGVTQNTSSAFKQKDTSAVTISGKGWKTTLPDYWKGKVAKSSRTDASCGKAWEVWPNGLKQYPILSMHVASSTLSNLSRVPSIGTVKFKSGQTARVVGLQNSYIGFVVRLNNGNTLIGSTSDYGRAIPDRGIPYSAANIAVVEDLQSLGSMSYNWNAYDDITLTCLQAIASRTTLT